MAKILKTKTVKVIEKIKNGEIRRNFGIIYRVLSPRKQGGKTLHRPLNCFDY